MRYPAETINPEYAAIQHLDPCTDKRYNSTTGNFVSFIVKKGSLFKDPIILLKRFLVKLAMGDAENAAAGYFHLWAFNYIQRDKLVEVFDEDELEAHQLLTHLFFNLRKECDVRLHPDWSILSITGEAHEDNSIQDLWNKDAVGMNTIFDVMAAPIVRSAFKTAVDLLTPMMME